ncbi:MAG: hypothetical protein A2504_17640 [Bdellovibrionales bacterium RIFOXYD12_FULL_39_22]|nr:MAG: hypothetical protein A2385_15340 [Bdellovibrionales bacterium RIFOXYB1_FULL_39_21]OFZ40617.1 MAG: hypothetical protein A2485_03425 [Bdellovibrionales bacterium RIFOXYC12_FULL_39_17]OFZ50435.1 MAG: hypothetical protein A2404_02640 [Bdellovibrionales bacterium RIFOXYC1_FULL_39_130]OFZ75286.1 MAG: hypothetical protein A2451_12880 [Bdellovibrionales bacterium RIFOXYC2_FULL_39_8]OFZ77694.1 MAG: hypothetical protein A2560_05010 [Bdellovibrionales bacterium RIFOXYD1_FULL_39_84]OFZ91728.1 MAG:
MHFRLLRYRKIDGKIYDSTIKKQACRATTRQMFTLCSCELADDFSIEKVMRFGPLPGVMILEDNHSVLSRHFAIACCNSGLLAMAVPRL